MTDNSTARLLLTSREAAKALAVSERTLWQLTAPRGPILSIRVGKRGVRYSLSTLTKWIESQQPEGNAPSDWASPGEADARCCEEPAPVATGWISRQIHE